ncbi:hypothetical protein [Oceanobacillus sp. J11TS1]|uniref:hypothetical protein n=1 Tax=Oceanobacillus sp. J11TS1 TaxID=2807191 RepID=UPI001B1A8C1E|nr:hypothetical protein [Oceanobacillus sp. J11TS1]GIO24551.1 hypothetical protein J11TS1_31320 [Oceanobacillus sp. J11TS1]
MESKFKFKLKQILILLAFVAVLVILNITLEFSPLGNILVMVPFILLGCWFTYQNFKRENQENEDEN